MKKNYYKALIGTIGIFTIGILGIMQLDIHPFIEMEQSGIVYIVYKEEEYEITIEPYETLESVLNQIPLDDDFDHKKINKTQILKNNDKLILPLKTEAPCISLNTATEEELQQLKGVGPKTAELIVEYRTKNGYFQHIEELMEVKGIGIKTFEKIADALCI